MNSPKGYLVYLEGKTRKRSDDIKLFFEAYDPPIPIDNDTLKLLLNNYRDKVLPINIFRNIKRIEVVGENLETTEFELIWLILFKTIKHATGGILIHPEPEQTEAIGYWKRNDVIDIPPKKLMELIQKLKDTNYWERIDLIIGNQ